MLLSKACDITGIVAIAFVWHGCFANLTHGEQQKNVDWALLEAVHSTDVKSAQGIFAHL